MTTHPSIYRLWKGLAVTDLEFKFYEAIYESNLKSVTECIKQGVDPNLTDEDDLTALHHAAIRGDLEMGEVLLSSPNIDVNKANPEGYTPLMYASIYRSEEFSKKLLENGANPNLLNDKHQSALHMAATQSSVKIAYYLLLKGAHINVRDVFDNSPLSIAVIDKASVPMARFLLKKGANATRTKQFPLFLECVLNCNSPMRLKLIKLLLVYGVDIHCLHPISKRNCLHYVAITGYIPAGQFLMPRGMENLDVSDLAGRTPAAIAWDHSNWAVYKLFHLTEEQMLLQWMQDEILEHICKLFDE